MRCLSFYKEQSAKIRMAYRFEFIYAPFLTACPLLPFELRYLSPG